MSDATSIALNQTAIYALRAMITLAELPAGAQLRADQVAARTKIPRHYLSKILRRLVLADLVHGQRGHGGGFALRRPACAITFANILHAVGTATAPTRCVFDSGRCDPDHPCVMHDAWTAINGAMLQWAESHTLAQL